MPAKRSFLFNFSHPNRTSEPKQSNKTFSPLEETKKLKVVMKARNFLLQGKFFIRKEIERRKKSSADEFEFDSQETFAYEVGKKRRYKHWKSLLGIKNNNEARKVWQRKHETSYQLLKYEKENDYDTSTSWKRFWQKFVDRSTLF